MKVKEHLHAYSQIPNRYSHTPFTYKILATSTGLGSKHRSIYINYYSNSKFTVMMLALPAAQKVAIFKGTVHKLSIPIISRLP